MNTNRRRDEVFLSAPFTRAQFHLTRFFVTRQLSTSLRTERQFSLRSKYARRRWLIGFALRMHDN